MKVHFRFLGRVIIFLFILSAVLFIFYQIITPKFLNSNSNWPTTSTYIGFYQMEKNSVDALFFGSSHAVSAYIPQELYNNYGITSYNLGCDQQNIIVSYYWLKEALRLQSPKVVILDCYILFPYLPNAPLNTPENSTRKALDFMRWSPVKMEATETICYYDENQSLLSYYMPNIRYHTRWTELTSDDFLFSSLAEQCELKGYSPLFGQIGDIDYTPFTEDANTENTSMHPLMLMYLEKIRALCEENNIALILVETPATTIDVSKYNAVSAYAKEYNLLYVDFNLDTTYQEAGFNFALDNCDDNHANIWGAQKITNYLGQIIQEQHIPQSVYDTQWEETRSYYENIMTSYN